LHDITDRVRLYEEIQNLAIIDPLTGIYNRRHFYNQALRGLERCRRFPASLAVIMLDIDNYKRFNDTFGHLKGDEALATIARQIHENIRRIDIFGRYGGEEFILHYPTPTVTKPFRPPNACGTCCRG
jgi:diguanylate cyclase (GGDEF)-like protein